jgi:hypothetical protein
MMDGAPARIYFAKRVHRRVRINLVLILSVYCIYTGALTGKHRVDVLSPKLDRLGKESLRRLRSTRLTSWKKSDLTDQEANSKLGWGPLQRSAARAIICVFLPTRPLLRMLERSQEWNCLPLRRQR